MIDTNAQGENNPNPKQKPLSRAVDQNQYYDLGGLIEIERNNNNNNEIELQETEDIEDFNDHRIHHQETLHAKRDMVDQIEALRSIFRS